MIKLNYNFKARFPAKTKNGKSYFKSSMKDKDGNYQNFTVFCANDIEIYDGAQVHFVEITAFDISEYKGKPQLTLFGVIMMGEDKVKTNAIDEAVKAAESKGLVPEIPSDDLPF